MDCTHVSCIGSPPVSQVCFSGSLHCKPIGILYERVMGLDVTGDGGGISGAKSSNTRGIFQLLRNQYTLS